ncbi:hypothetical protein MRX96_038338 [Rhipicephalus microplus]
MLNARTWAGALLALLVLSVTSAGKGAPQFVPNGRYGRRSVTPPLAETSRGTSHPYMGLQRIVGTAKQHRAAKERRSKTGIRLSDPLVTYTFTEREQ